MVRFLAKKKRQGNHKQLGGGGEIANEGHNDLSPECPPTNPASNASKKNVLGGKASQIRCLCGVDPQLHGQARITLPREGVGEEKMGKAAFQS